MENCISYLHVIPVGIDISSYRNWAEAHNFTRFVVSLETYWAQLVFDDEESFEAYAHAWKEFRLEHQA